MEMSNVPPPKSYTIMRSSFFLSKPYARAAAVGSLITRFTSSPAISPATFVAFLWLSSKYAGTVIIASVIFSPSFSSASCLSFLKTIAEISGGLYHFSPIFTSTLPSEASLISYGSNFLSL